MWALDNRTSYAIDRSWTRDSQGHHHWIVAVKATFEFDAHAQLRLADEQLAPLHAPEHFGPRDSSSVRYDADLSGRKPGTDVVLNASAHAPGGVPVQETWVRLRVGPRDKTLLVRGPSRYVYGIAGLRVSAPDPFVTRPIRYELAYGGSDCEDEDPRRQLVDTRNPVGLGVTRDDTQLHGQPAPCIYYPRGNPAKVGPAGFGALASHWSPRRELAGTYDQAWARTKKPLLPDDFDPRHWQCAPEDQQFAEPLRGGERVGLFNLSPEGAVEFELPRVVLLASTQLRRQRVEHGFTLSTVLIEPDDRRVVMVWLSSLPVRAPDVDELHGTRVEERRA